MKGQLNWNVHEMVEMKSEVQPLWVAVFWLGDNLVHGGVLKLGRKSAVYLFLLVITGSFTLKNVDKHDGYILSDVSELFVARAH